MQPSITQTKPRRIKLWLAAILVSITTVLVGVVSPPPPAQASVGAGGYWTPYGGWLGNYVASDGTRVYCLDVLVDTVGYDGGAGTLVTSTGTGPQGDSRSVSGNELRRLNYAISVWGQTSDAVTAAAVAAYVYNYTSVNHYGNGIQYAGGAPTATRNAITAKYNQIVADTNANYANNGGGTGGGHLDFDVDATNNYLGTMAVVNLLPVSAVGTVTLTNGIFIDTGSNTKTGVRANDVLEVQGVPPENSEGYKISGVGTFTAGSGRVYSSNGRVRSSGGMQRTIGPGSSSPGTVSFQISGSDPFDRETAFLPVVATQVETKHVSAGEELVDVLTFSTAENEEGLNNNWFEHEDHGFTPIKATGTIYGPFLEQPIEQDIVPVGAPVAATGIEVETTASDGPNVDYTVRSGFFPMVPGFYVWVWEIDYANQRSTAQLFLPDDYYFIDSFGQTLETNISKMSIEISTVVSHVDRGPGQSVTDEVTVSAVDDLWLLENGDPIPATLTGTAYYSTTEPVLAAAAPPTAEVLGTLTVVASGPGDITSPSFTLPLKAGWVTFQWCLVESDQPTELQGMIEESCDDWGQPSETVRLTVAAVTTQARSTATIFDGLTDTAIVTGQVSDDTELVFELFKRPEIGDPILDATGHANGNLWDADMLDALGGDPACLIENRVAVTAPVLVTAGNNHATSYASTPVQVTGTGEYWWIERLQHRDPVTDEVTVLHSGECGLPNETTLVDTAAVVTKATSSVGVGGRARDTATIIGPVPDLTSATTQLTFEVFRAGKFDPVDGLPICNLSNRVANLDTPVIVTGPGEYQSAEVKLTETGDYWWVETLTYVLPDHTTLIGHVGACGLANETTTVTMLPNLGGWSTGTLSPSAIALLLILGGATAVTAGHLVRVPARVGSHRTGARHYA